MSSATALVVRRAARSLAPSLLAALLCAACGRAPSVGTATPTTALAAPPTPAVPPAEALSWAPHLPPTVAPAGANQGPALAVAQSDGNTAYLCAPAGASSPTAVSVWLTRDRGAHWTPTASIAVTTEGPIEVAGCSLLVDANQPGTVIVRADALPVGGCVPYVDCVAYEPYVTVDFGAHWSPLRGPLGYPRELATRGTITYALFSSPPRSASSATVEFVKSTDGMRTWRDVSSPVSGGVSTPPLQSDVTAFWLNPVSGALLTMTSSGLINDEHFSSSPDGLYWTALSAPPFPFAEYAVVVQQPFTNAPWRICGGDPANWSINGQTNTHIDDIACTADGGAHWVTRHGGFTLNGAGLPDYTLVAIADDGDLLLTSGSTLERFALGSGGMDSLGPVPNAGTLVYAASGGAGVLWAGPANNYQNPDPQGRVYTASYA